MLFVSLFVLNVVCVLSVLCANTKVMCVFALMCVVCYGSYACVNLWMMCYV